MRVFSGYSCKKQQSKLKGVSDFKKSKLPDVLEFVCYYLIRCFSSRTGGTDAMGKQFLDLLWSILTYKTVDFGSILWDDLLSYVGRNQPRQGLTDVTSARFWSLCIKDLHSTTNISLGAYINFFVCRKHKRYSLPKDQTIFGPIRQLPLHILTKVGLITKLVSGLMEATNDVPPYRSIPPSPS